MKPLSKITVVDLTENLPGPFCSMTFADLGARVIKVERPGGDPLRHSPGMWASLNRGKESLVLDLKTESGRDTIGKLADRTDVVLEGWRPGVAERLGADYPTLSARNPGLVYCSISGFGQDGPWRDRAGHDINYLALSGYLDVQARAEGRPSTPPLLAADMAAAMYASTMVLAALNGRHASGEGAYIDLSMAESVVSLLGPELGRLDDDGASREFPNVTAIPTYGLFPCADGRWLSLGIVHEDHFWRRFCKATGLNDLAGMDFKERMAGREGLRQRIDQALLTQPSYEWERLLLKADVPAAAIMPVERILGSAQLQSRNVFAEVEGHRFVSQPARFSTGPVVPTAGPPKLGEHTDAILNELGEAGNLD